jgi:hypothetical protein
MTEDQLIADARTLGPWQRHRFIVLTLFLVGVALALYASSGAAQLDLSRPGYVSVRDKAVQVDDFEGFPTSGSIDKDTLKQFRSLYEKQSKEATNVDSFGGDVMSDKALSIDAPAK